LSALQHFLGKFVGVLIDHSSYCYYFHKVAIFILAYLKTIFFENE